MNTLHDWFLEKSVSPLRYARSGSIFDIATAVCSRSDCAICFVNQHRALPPWEACAELPTHAKLGLSLGPCASHVTACALPPGSTQLKKTQDVFWSATIGSIAYGTTIAVLPFANHYVVFGPASANASQLQLCSTFFCSKLLSEATGFASLLLGFVTRPSGLITC